MPEPEPEPEPELPPLPPPLLLPLLLLLLGKMLVLPLLLLLLGKMLVLPLLLLLLGKMLVLPERPLVISVIWADENADEMRPGCDPPLVMGDGSRSSPPSPVSDAETRFWLLLLLPPITIREGATDAGWDDSEPDRSWADDDCPGSSWADDGPRWFPARQQTSRPTSAARALTHKKRGNTKLFFT